MLSPRGLPTASAMAGLLLRASVPIKIPLPFVKALTALPSDSEVICSIVDSTWNFGSGFYFLSMPLPFSNFVGSRIGRITGIQVQSSDHTLLETPALGFLIGHTENSLFFKSFVLTFVFLVSKSIPGGMSGHTHSPHFCCETAPVRAKLAHMDRARADALWLMDITHVFVAAQDFKNVAGSCGLALPATR